jgi:hypothetical protein
MTPEEIDAAVEVARKGHPMMAPCTCKAMKRPHYVLFLHGVNADEMRARGCEWHPGPAGLPGVGDGWAVAQSRAGRRAR